MPFSLYLHFPFCTNKCAYCDFYKELHNCGSEARFFDALMVETRLTADTHIGKDKRVSSIFVGGGTPSLVNTDSLGRWLRLVRDLFDVVDGIEFSIEMNPESVTRDNLSALRDLGVTRPVFGIQSFDRNLLMSLGRDHDSHQSRRAIYLANALGFRNIGVDLIFGLPGQTSRMLSSDLDQIIDLEPRHISFYQLIVEPGTPLAERVASGEMHMPDQELSLALYQGGCERFAEAGYRRYEVSSFAQPGFECAHNIRYWEGGDYLGLGPAAHSFVGGRRFANPESLDQYVDALSRGILPSVPDGSGREERMTEAILLGLRTSQGISRSAFSRRFGVDLEERLDREQYRVFLRSGHLVAEDDNLRLSDHGVYLADEITRRLVK